MAKVQQQRAVPADFTSDPQVVRLLEALEHRWRNQPPISDITDGDGHQYVDLVMQGGGTLGIALVGYAYALEHVGIRFKSIGGTSAGAITATLLAALADPAEAKSEALLSIIAKMDMASFLDGPKRHKKLVIGASQGAGKLKLFWLGARSFKKLCRDLGLHPGDAFELWLREHLDRVGINTNQALQDRMKRFPSNMTFPIDPDDPDKPLEGYLKMVSADITTMTKAVFPDNAALYFAEPQNVSPARFVRASMSIPIVFFPFRAGDLAINADAAQRWREQTSFPGDPPETVRFVDGGILSNFPIALFHRHDRKPPRCPTLGVRLGPNRRSNTIASLANLAQSSFNTSRAGADYDFLARHKEYRRLVQRIDTGTISWLNFNMPKTQQIELFRKGVEAATHFLINRFNWHRYKCLRAQLDEREPPAGCQDELAPDLPKEPAPDHPTNEELESIMLQ